MVQLRCAEGIERTSFNEQTGLALDAVLGPVRERLVELGLFCDDGCRLWLTRQGKCVADAVMQECMKDEALGG